MNKVELLAPAGSMDSLVASINAGCDAVYIGGSRFGARAFAENPENEILKNAIDYVHRYDKRLYLTVNTLLKEEELKDELYEYLAPFYLQGLDAVIVQDVGVLKFITDHFPKLPIHLSTQMTINMAEGANLYKQSAYGKNITRLVPSRELSLAELSTMRKGTELEIETFVHGALCYSYSGQCLMSSMIGGRSGNRGRCAQPCRMQYQCEIDGRKRQTAGEYLLSPKDMCTLDLIPEIIEAGVNSFKIEGRMKHYEYACGVTEIYRRYIDRYYELGMDQYREYRDNHKDERNSDTLRLMDLYNRGSFSHGYYDASSGKSMMSMERPSHNGVLVGTVMKIRGINAGILLNEDVNAQDVLEIRISDKTRYEFTVKDDTPTGELLFTNFKADCKVVEGLFVYRTKNQKLLGELTNQYLNQTEKLPIEGTLYAAANEPLCLTVSRGSVSCTVYGDMAEAALKQPVTKEKLTTQVEKTNDSPFVFEQLTIDLKNDVFIPISRINDLRRCALTELEAKLTESYKRVDDSIPNISSLSDYNRSKEDNLRVFDINLNSSEEDESINDSTGIMEHLQSKANLPLITVTVINEAQLDSILEFTQVDRVIIDITDIEPEQIIRLSTKVVQAEKRCFLALPRITREVGYQFFKKHADKLTNSQISGYLIRNAEELYLIKQALASKTKDKEVLLDFNLYAMNQESKKFWQECGATELTAPLELNHDEWMALGCQDMTVLVYGRIPLMVSTQCLFKNTKECQKQKKETSGDKPEEMRLIDRLDKKLRIMTHCEFCYNTIYNAEIYSLAGLSKEVLEFEPKSIRLDFHFENALETKHIIRTLINEYFEGKEPEKTFYYGQTKGHYRRGVQ